MIYKNGVVESGVIFVNNKRRHLRGLSRELIFALMTADKLSQQCYDIEVVVTGLGGESHKANSCHYGRLRDNGYYIDGADIRTNHYTKEQGTELIVELREMLGPDYQIIDERESKSHAHIEYDPK